MSTFSTLAILIAIVGATLLMALISRLLRMDMERLELLEKWQGRMTASFAKIIHCKKPVPAGLIKDLEFLNSLVGNKLAGFALVAYYSGKREVKSPRSSTGMNGDDVIEFLATDRRLQEAYIDAFASTILTVSYRSRLLGFIIRSGFKKMIAERQWKPMAKFVHEAERRLPSKRLSKATLRRSEATP